MQARYGTLFAPLVAMVLMTASFASAGIFSNVFVYGDSLSDTGNVYAFSGQTFPPSPPYYMGRFSNGPVAVEYLANTLGAPLTSFAWGGATTGVGDVIDGGTQTTFGSLGMPGMRPQVKASLSTITPLAPTSLFVVWGGPNDFIANGSVTVAVADILTIVGKLRSVGATHILVPGMPDLGLAPAFYGYNAQATAFSVAFNQTLVANLPRGVTYFDTFSFFDRIVANPGAYGFADVTDPCFNGSTVCNNPNQYLFWDDLHPTTAADRLLAAQFSGTVVPEPSTLLMLGTSVAGLAVVLRRNLTR